MCGRMRESWLAARNSVRRRDHLLAHLGRDTLVRSERQTASIRRPEGDGHGEGFRERWVPCRGHRQGRIHGDCKVERIMAPVCSATMRRADTVVYKFPYGEDE